MNKKFDADVLDRVVRQMSNTVSSGKNEVFSIAEQMRQEHESLVKDLEAIKAELTKIFDDNDRLTVSSSHARRRLATVSSELKRFSEEDIRKAYEDANTIQNELFIVRERETQLKLRRDDMSRRLIGIKKTLERAEYLIGQFNIISNFLNSDFREIDEWVKTVHQKQELGFRIIEAQEEERKKISREIHDVPAQIIANIMMRSELLERTYRDHGAEAMLGEVREFKETARVALHEVRRIIYDLRPMTLDDLGLVPTLRKYLQTLEEANGTIKIDFRTVGEEHRLPMRLEAPIFRLVQEAVQNVFKHANATEITVKMEVLSDKLTALIRDNGKGFDVNQKRNKSFGLIGMKERIELLEGDFQLSSKIGGGTTVFIKVPIQV